MLLVSIFERVEKFPPFFIFQDCSQPFAPESSICPHFPEDSLILRQIFFISFLILVFWVGSPTATFFVYFVYLSSKVKYIGLSITPIPKKVESYF